MLLFPKGDTELDDEALAEAREDLLRKLDWNGPSFEVSAATGEGVAELLDAVRAAIPVAAPWSAVNLAPPPPDDVEATRVEVRCPDPTANTYLAFAAMLAAGLDGIEKGMKLTDPVEESLFEMTADRVAEKGIEELPGSLGAAIYAMEQDEVIAEAQKAIDNTRSMGIGLSPCTIPEKGSPNFTIEPGKMEVGIGHHGEPGLEICDLETSAQMARRMTDIILPDLPFNRGDEVVTLISGLGSTPFMELYILHNDVAAILSEQGIKVHRPYVGQYFTSLEMAGVTLTLMKLDESLKACMDYECDSMGMRQFATKG